MTAPKGGWYRHGCITTLLLLRGTRKRMSLATIHALVFRGYERVWERKPGPELDREVPSKKVGGPVTEGGTAAGVHCVNGGTGH